MTPDPLVGSVVEAMSASSLGAMPGGGRWCGLRQGTMNPAHRVKLPGGGLGFYWEDGRLRWTDTDGEGLSGCVLNIMFYVGGRRLPEVTLASL